MDDLRCHAVCHPPPPLPARDAVQAERMKALRRLWRGADGVMVGKWKVIKKEEHGSREAERREKKDGGG